jgi:hypothetical protein
MLYAGTTDPLPRKEWDKDVRGLSVNALTESDASIVNQFTHREVQCIGSTSGCGCDFPHVTLTRGEWIGYPEVIVDDPEWEATELVNREALVALLRDSAEKNVELYGVWYGDFAKQVNVREEIPLARILEPDFRFKERGLYTVSL